MAQPWIFDPSTPTPGLWSVGGFTFDLLSSTIVTQNAAFLRVTGTGIVSGNGFEPTAMGWSFSIANPGGEPRTTFSFSATGDVGSAECRAVQLDAQAAVASGGPYKNKGQLVKTAAKVVGAAEEAGEITDACADCIMDQFARGIAIAAQEPCGF
jgi:hypothetical protein